MEEEYSQKILMNENDKKVSPLELFISIEKLKWQVGRLVSDAESEEGTISRMTKVLKEQIEKLETEMRAVLYNSENGLILQIDRLTQEKMHKQNMHKSIVALWISVITIIVGMALHYIFKI